VKFRNIMLNFVPSHRSWRVRASGLHTMLGAFFMRFAVKVFVVQAGPGHENCSEVMGSFTSVEAATQLQENLGSGSWIVERFVLGVFDVR